MLFFTAKSNRSEPILILFSSRFLKNGIANKIYLFLLIGAVFIYLFQCAFDFFFSLILKLNYKYKLKSTLFATTQKTCKLHNCLLNTEKSFNHVT